MHLKRPEVRLKAFHKEYKQKNGIKAGIESRTEKHMDKYKRFAVKFKSACLIKA